MVDWQVVDLERAQNEPPPLLPPEPPRRSRHLGRVLLLLLVLGAAILWARREQAARTVRMEGDLRQFVLEEERARAAGRVAQIPQLLSQQSPRSWRHAYEHSFVTKGQMGVIEVREIRWSGAGALLTVERDGQPQLRYYRVEEGRWRRAPIPEELLGMRHVQRLPEGLVVRYREVDSLFARGLIADLPALLAEIEGWGIEPVLLEIEIRPIENTFVPVERQRGVLVVTSPLTYLDQRATGASVTETVRLAIAERLLPDGEGRPRATEMLRGSTRLYAAARDVQRRRWALAPEQVVRGREAWVQSLDGGWSSPFVDPWEPNGATARIVADYVYEILGSPRLTRLLLNAHENQRWNTLLLDELGVRAYHLEAEALAWASGDHEALAALVGRRPGATVADPPFVSRLSEADRSDYLMGTVPGLPGLVDMVVQSATFETEAGEPLPVGCATDFPSVTVDGRWLDAGALLFVTRLTPREEERLFPSLPTGLDASASLLFIEEPVAPRRAPGDWTLWHADSSGSVEALEVDPTLLPYADGLVPLPDGRLLAHTNLVRCYSRRLLLLTPHLEVAAEWRLVGPQLVSSGVGILRPGQDDLLYVTTSNPNDVVTSFSTLKWAAPGGAQWLQPLFRPVGTVYIGWSEPLERLLAVELSSRGGVTLIGLDTASTIESLEMEGSVVARQAVLSRDGKSLYIIGSAAPGRPPDRLIVMDLVSGEQATILMLDEQRNFLTAPQPLLWEGDEVRLLLHAADLKTDRQQLLMVDPAAGGSPRLVTSEPAGVQISGVLLCEVERVIFATHVATVPEGEARPVVGRLWEARAGAPPTLLFESQGTLRPLICGQVP